MKEYWIAREWALDTWSSDKYIQVDRPTDNTLYLTYERALGHCVEGCEPRKMIVEGESND